MECRFCGKEITLRTRLTGETTFCSPEHRRLYHEEHSRLGLARLLEEVKPSSKPQGESPESPAEEERGEETADRGLTAGSGGELPEQSEGDGDPAQVWNFPPVPFEARPLFRETTRLRFDASEYVAGRPEPTAKPRGTAPAARKAESEPPAKARPAIKLGRVGDNGPWRKPKPAVAATKAPPVEAKAPAAVAVEEPESEAPAAPARAAPTARKKAKPAATKADPPQVTRSRSATLFVDEPEPAPEAEPEEKEEIPFAEVSKGQTSRAGILKMAAIGIALATAGFFGVLYMSSADADPGAATLSAEDQWIFDWAKQPEGDVIALFGPSQEWTDYRAEAHVNRYVGLGWVFRASDPDNYYVMRLAGGRQANSMNLVRYAMVNGQRRQYDEAPVPAPATKNDIVGVRLEIRGSQFRLFVEGEMCAVWSNGRHRRGGFGVVGSGENESLAGQVKITQIGSRSRLEGGLPHDSGRTETANVSERPARESRRESNARVSQT